MRPWPSSFDVGEQHFLVPSGHLFVYLESCQWDTTRSALPGIPFHSAWPIPIVFMSVESVSESKS